MSSRAGALKNKKLAIGCGIAALILLVLTPVAVSFVIAKGFHTLVFVYGQPVVALSQDEKNFDPIKEKDHVLHLAGTGTGFVSLSASGVRRDGTQDLTSEIVKPRATYEFFGQALHGDAPLGVSRGTEQITINAYPKGNRLTKIVGVERFYSYEIGLRKEVFNGGPGRYRPWPFPTCSFRTLWDYAVKRGTPESAVAAITFRDGKYTFEIRETEYKFEFDQNCAPTTL